MDISEEKKWYVMRDLKRANACERAYQRLCADGFEVYTPLTQKPIMRNGRKVYREVPYVSDLLFVREYRSVLDAEVREIDTLQYRFAKGCAWNEPMIVGDAEMERFMWVVNNFKAIQFYTPEEVSPAMYGKWIRIVGGGLDGFEGRLKSTRGSKVKRLIVELPGLLAVGVEVDAQYIQLVKRHYGSR